MSVTGSDPAQRGHAQLKRRPRTSNNEATGIRFEPFTPPCSGCNYPMLKGETRCLRCGKERQA